MLSEIQVKNYRGIDDLNIRTLGRVNLIAGRNNSGKTALLESIFLLSGWGNPDLAVRVNAFRGVDFGSMSANAVRDYLWKPLFSNFSVDRTISISGRFEPLGQHSLDITLKKARTADIQLGDSKPVFSSGGMSLDTLELSFCDHEGVEHIGSVRPDVQPAGQVLQFTPPNANVGYIARFLSTRAGNLQNDAIELGRLRTRKQAALVVDALRKIDPRLRSIEDNSASGSSLIWGDIGLPELLPMSSMGEGMTRVTRLVLAIMSSAGGVVLIDEIENGLHHSVLPVVWETIDHASKQFNTQVFATTHSLECITAADSALRGSDFLFHRLDAVETGIRCVTYDVDERHASIKHGLEMR